MDLSSSIIPRSDQINADDLIAGPITVTIAEVKAGNKEQPFDFILTEYPGRAYRPSMGMRRIIVNAWGRESSAYAGRRITLYRNPEITFGRERVGGIEISHMSHIELPITFPLTRARGRRTDFTVQPLIDRDWAAELAVAGDDIDAVFALGKAAKAAGADQKPIIDKYNELKGS